MKGLPNLSKKDPCFQDMILDASLHTFFTYLHSPTKTGSAAKLLSGGL